MMEKNIPPFVSKGRLFSCGCLLLAFCLGGSALGAADGSKELPGRMVSAVYMNFQPPVSFPKGLPSRQNDIVGRPLPGEALWKDLAKATRWDVEQGKKAGINAFATWMYPRLGDRESGQAQYEALFTEMQKAGGMTFYPDYWWYRMDPENWGKTVGSWKRDPDPGVEAEMRRHGEILRSWAERFGNVWAKKEGRLVVGMQDHALFANVPYDKAMEYLFAPLGGRDKVYLVLSRYPVQGNIAADWLAGADAICDWDANRTYGDSLRELPLGKAFASEHGKPWWPSFAPGFFQSRAGDSTAPKSPMVYERFGIIAYRHAWLDAIAEGSPTVYLITWNDVSEDSEIMPTAGHDRAIQRLTRYFSDWYHKGKQPRIAQEELLVFHHPQVASKLQLPAGRLATTGPENGLTPPTDYVTVCSFLKAPATVSVNLRKLGTVTQDLPAGFHTWLLYYPSTTNGEVYPKPQEGLTVTVLKDSFTDTDVTVQVQRGNVDLGRYFSHQPIVEAAGRADMGTVGDVFTLPK